MGEQNHVHDYDEQTGSCYCGDVWDESKVQPTDMFGNDLTKTDSFGTPRTKQVWVGRVEGDRNAKVSFGTVAEAEHFIAQLEIFYPEEVHAGNFYIDGPAGADRRD